MASCVSFGRREEEDAMSLSASEKDDWVDTERDFSSGEPSDFRDVRVLTKAVLELELTWDPPQEPVKSKLNSWFLAACRHQTGARTSMPFFPDVHEQVVKTWSAPQLAPTRPPRQCFHRRGGNPQLNTQDPCQGNRCCPSLPLISQNPRIQH